jgi:hypothetical protein
MSMFDTFDRTGSVEFPFPTDIVFRAVETAVGNLPGMEVDEASPLAGHLSVKTSMSAFSWGEKVAISVLEAGPSRSRVQIGSAAKTIFGSGTTHGKNRKNVQRIIAATSEVLEQHRNESSAEPGSGADVEERLRRLADLRARGVVSDTEYAERRAQILSEI